MVVRSIGSDLRMDYTAVGQTTHLAARMEQLAPPGTIRLTAETLRLAEGFVAGARRSGPMPVKGLAAADRGVRADGRRRRPHAPPGRARPAGSRRFVGPRRRDGRSSAQAPRRPRQGRGQIVAVVGEPGVGKSRLFYEFTHSHHVGRRRGWLVLEASSVSYGKATPFLPLVELLRGYFRIDDRDDLRERSGRR